MSKLPLEGITVLDFGWVVAGPHGARLLETLGATVIRLESGTRLDPMRIDTMRTGVTDCFAEGGWGFQENSRNKLGICLNLKSQKGREILHKLIKKVDVVTCNFAPGGFHKLGLDFETLKEIRKDIIVVNASGLGDNGPYGGYMTFAPVLTAMTGITSVLGYEDEPPYGYSGLLPDYMGGIAIACAVTGALVHRERTGEGQFVDLSQAEATMQGMGPALLDQQVNGVCAGTFGNHHYAHQMAPHNCYPCREENTWLAIAVGDDAEWARLKAEIGSDDVWVELKPENDGDVRTGVAPGSGTGICDAKFDTAAGRLENEAELDALLTAWTKTQTPKAAAERLQAAGVSAARVQNTKDFLYDDAHARARNYFRTIDFNDEITPSKFYLTGPIINMRGTYQGNYTPGPPLAKDNDYILKEMLGLDAAYIMEAEKEGAFK